MARLRLPLPNRNRVPGRCLERSSSAGRRLRVEEDVPRLMKQAGDRLARGSARFDMDDWSPGAQKQARAPQHLEFRPFDIDFEHVGGGRRCASQSSESVTTVSVKRVPPVWDVPYSTRWFVARERLAMAN